MRKKINCDVLARMRTMITLMKGKPIGWRVYGAGIVVMALVTLKLGDFSPAQPLPQTFPERALLAYAAGAFMLVAGIAIEWRRCTYQAALALMGYYFLIVVILMHGYVIVTHPTAFVAYSSTAMQLAIAAAGLILYSTSPGIDPKLAGRLTGLGQRIFGICAIFFGAAHFVYLNLTAPIVPAWLPPSQTFWAFATGVAHIAGGIAILTRVQARLAAILLTIMYASFTPLVLVPLALGDPSNHFFWTENAVNILLVGSAWVVADSLRASCRSDFANRRSSTAVKEVSDDCDQPSYVWRD